MGLAFLSSQPGQREKSELKGPWPQVVCDKGVKLMKCEEVPVGVGGGKECGTDSWGRLCGLDSGGVLSTGVGWQCRWGGGIRKGGKEGAGGHTWSGEG